MQLEKLTIPSLCEYFNDNRTVFGDILTWDMIKGEWCIYQRGKTLIQGKEKDAKRMMLKYIDIRIGTRSV